MEKKLTKQEFEPFFRFAQRKTQMGGSNSKQFFVVLIEFDRNDIFTKRQFSNGGMVSDGGPTINERSENIGADNILKVQDSFIGTLN